MNNLDRYATNGINLRTGDPGWDAYFSHRFTDKGLCQDCLASEPDCLDSDRAGPVCPGEHADPAIASERRGGRR